MVRVHKVIRVFPEMIFTELKILSHIMCRSLMPNFIQITQCVESTDQN